MKRKKKCFEIKDLEERLACLHERYAELTKQIERERENVTTDEVDNLHQIHTTRQFILKQIERTENRIHSLENPASHKTRVGRVDVGTKVRLQNHKTSLEVEVVEESEANPINGLISKLSPIGKAISGKRVGETVKVILPKGTMPYTIKALL